MSRDDPERICENCEFWCRDIGMWTIGECRADPPTINKGITTTRDYWCGHFFPTMEFFQKTQDIMVSGNGS